MKGFLREAQGVVDGMVAQVVSLFSRRPSTEDWSQQELAEFYRVESALVQAGICVETDRGLSDEGDPWFVFCRAEDGEVVVHFARFDGSYVIAGPGYERAARGRDFAALTRDLISRHPLVQRPRGSAKKSNVVLHPAAFLIAIVGTAFFRSGEVRAAERPQEKVDAHDEAYRHRTALSLNSTSGAAAPVIALDAQQALTILAGAMIAATWRDRGNAELPAAPLAHADGFLSLPDPEPSATAPQPIAVLTVAADTPPPVATSPAEVKALFAVMALLNDLTSADVADAAPQSTPAGPIALPFPEAETQPDTHGVFEVSLVFQDGQTVQAFDLLRGAHIFADLTAGDVAYLDALPRLLAELIEGGVRARVESDGAVDLDASDVLVQPAGAPSPVSPVILDDSALIPALPLPEPPADQALPGFATSLPGVHAPTAEIGEVIDYFVTHTQDVDIIVVDDQIVIYDTRLTTNSHAQASFQSITFDFDDGSSISLVGAVSAITGYDLVG